MTQAEKGDAENGKEKGGEKEKEQRGVKRPIVPALVPESLQEVGFRVWVGVPAPWCGSSACGPRRGRVGWGGRGPAAGSVSSSRPLGSGPGAAAGGLGGRRGSCEPGPPSGSRGMLRGG